MVVRAGSSSPAMRMAALRSALPMHDVRPLQELSQMHHENFDGTERSKRPVSFGVKWNVNAQQQAVG